MSMGSVILRNCVVTCMEEKTKWVLILESNASLPKYCMPKLLRCHTFTHLQTTSIQLNMTAFHIVFHVVYIY